MKKQTGKENRIDGGLRARLLAGLGAPTDGKLAGGAFSAAAVFSPLLFLIFSVALAVCGVVVEEENLPDWYIYASFLLPQTTFLAAAWVCCVWKGVRLLSVVKAQGKCKPIWFLVAVAAQAGLLCCSELNVWFLKLLGWLGYENTDIVLPSVEGIGFAGVLLAVAALPAVAEEIFFRGAVLRGTKLFGEAWGAVLCGALFALYHQNPAQTAYQFVCGVAFAWIAIRSGSVLPTVVAHFLNNALIIFDYKYPFLARAYEEVLIASALCAVGVIAFFVWEKAKEKGGCAEKGADERTGNRADGLTEKKTFWLAAAIGLAVCAVVWLVNFFSGL